MNIPERIAVEGLETINLYKKYLQDIKDAQNKISELGKQIKAIEESMVDIMYERGWLTYSHYPKQKYSVHMRSLKLEALIKEHRRLALEHVLVDNKQLQLREDMYNRGWLQDWQRDEWEKFL